MSLLHASDHSPRHFPLCRSREVWSVAGGVVPVRMMGKALQWGFLGMIFLASGTSALQCHSLNYIWSTVSKVDWGEHFSTLGEIVNCSNACMEAQLKLSLAKSLLLATYIGCADKEDKDGKGHVTTDNPHFNIQYNESYCSRDLCNNKMSPFDWSPGENTAPGESGNNHCYAGITRYSGETLKGETCHKGYNQCYSGNASVKVGIISSLIFIKTCSRPNFTESQSLSFGPIKFNHVGFSCLGSYCNGAKTGARSHGKETVVTCWFSFFALCAISLGWGLSCTN